MIWHATQAKIAMFDNLIRNLFHYDGKFVRKFRKMLFECVVETKLKSARVIIPGPANRQAGAKKNGALPLHPIRLPSTIVS
jgi:hypothetical protein